MFLPVSIDDKLLPDLDIVVCSNLVRICHRCSLQMPQSTKEFRKLNRVGESERSNVQCIFAERFNLFSRLQESQENHVRPIRPLDCEEETEYEIYLDITLQSLFTLEKMNRQWSSRHRAKVREGENSRNYVRIRRHGSNKCNNECTNVDIRNLSVKEMYLARKESC